MTGETSFENLKLSVIVPLFNGGASVAQNLACLRRELETHFNFFEVIVVSDGSTDGTNDSLKSCLWPGFRTIITEKNAGKGAAVRAGFQQAAGNLLLFIDGDMDIHPREVQTFVSLMETSKCDVVIGSKLHPRSVISCPPHRRFLSWSFRTLVKHVFKPQVTDTQVGIKLFRREVVSAVLPHLNINGYGFDLEMLLLARLKGFTHILEAPVRIDYKMRRGRRPVFKELRHVWKVGRVLASDTAQIYRGLRAHKM